MDSYKNGIEKMLEYRCSHIDNILTSNFEESQGQLTIDNKNLLNYSSRWLGMKKMKITCILILFAYSMPALIQIFLKDYLYKRSVLEYAMALTYSLRIAEYIDGFISAMAPTLREITAYGRLENFIEKAKSENTGCKKLKIVDQVKPEFAVWLKRCNIYLNTSHILKNLSLRIQSGAKMILWGAHGSGKHVLVKLIMCVYNLDENSEEIESKFYSKGEDGEAYILGYDVSKVNLRELR